MANVQRINRRQVLGAGLALGVASNEGFSSTVEPSAVPAARPLAQDFTVVLESPDDMYVLGPGLARLPGGKLVAMVPLGPQGKGGPASRVHLVESADGGRSWSPIAQLPVADAPLLVHRGQLHALTIRKRGTMGSLAVVRSDDGGVTWSRPSTVIDAPLWNLQNAFAVKDGQLYWAVNVGGFQKLAAVAADLFGDLTDPKAWRISPAIQRPAIPKELSRNMYPPSAGRWYRPWGSDLWLEPNVIDVGGRLMALSRMVIDEYATANLAAVCDIEDRNGELRMHFTQFYPLPGGQNRFYILRDEPSRLFWMASNLPADSQGSLPLWDNLRDKGYVGGPGNDRRTLILSYSIDGLNWFQAGCIARWKSPIRSFMYPVMAIDGDDLLIVARSNRDNPNQHDANLCTCHRIAGFRSLALNLYPGEDDLPHLDTQPPIG